MHEEDVASTVAQLIREQSIAGRLMHSEEILALVRARGDLASPGGDNALALDVVLEQVLNDHEDLREIRGPDGSQRYYSQQWLTDAYASLLASREDNPCRLMAQVVRDNSLRYPRPVPVESFREAPFDLTGDEIAACLDAIGADAEYRDIEQTFTSIGTAYLYSTLHLEPDHAVMLAEWLDVGQANNP